MPTISQIFAAEIRIGYLVMDVESPRIVEDIGLRPGFGTQPDQIVLWFEGGGFMNLYENESASVVMSEFEF